MKMEAIFDAEFARDKVRIDRSVATLLGVSAVVEEGAQARSGLAWTRPGGRRRRVDASPIDALCQPRLARSFSFCAMIDSRAFCQSASDQSRN